MLDFDYTNVLDSAVGSNVNCGQTPTAALGVTDQHSQLQLSIEGPDDKSFLFWAVRELTIEASQRRERAIVR